MHRLLALPLVALFVATALPSHAQDTRLLRQPTISSDHIAFAYGSDLWVVERDGGLARRLTSTAAVESEPRFSPDGRHIAFTSNRSGSSALYVVPVEGGTPTRLTWYPAGTRAVGWTPDGSRILYATTRETAPSGYNRLWTVSPDGGPSELLPAPWGFDGSYSPDGSQLIIDRMSRWESEFQDYRGGQNTPLILMDLETLDETWLPNERTTDTQPIWLENDAMPKRTRARVHSPRAVVEPSNTGPRHAAAMGRPLRRRGDRLGRSRFASQARLCCGTWKMSTVAATARAAPVAKAAAGPAIE